MQRQNLQIAKRFKRASVTPLSIRPRKMFTFRSQPRAESDLPPGTRGGWTARRDGRGVAGRWSPAVAGLLVLPGVYRFPPWSTNPSDTLADLRVLWLPGAWTASGGPKDVSTCRSEAFCSFSTCCCLLHHCPVVPLRYPTACWGLNVLA